MLLCHLCTLALYAFPAPSGDVCTHAGPYKSGGEHPPRGLRARVCHSMYDSKHYLSVLFRYQRPKSASRSVTKQAHPFHLPLDYVQHL